MTPAAHGLPAPLGTLVYRAGLEPRCLLISCTSMAMIRAGWMKRRPMRGHARDSESSFVSLVARRDGVLLVIEHVDIKGFAAVEMKDDARSVEPRLRVRDGKMCRTEAQPNPDALERPGRPASARERPADGVHPAPAWIPPSDRRGGTEHRGPGPGGARRARAKQVHPQESWREREPHRRRRARRERPARVHSRASSPAHGSSRRKTAPRGLRPRPRRPRSSRDRMFAAAARSRRRCAAAARAFLAACRAPKRLLREMTDRRSSS